MSLFESHTDLILSLAKFTSALLIAFAVAPFLKRPALRAAFWAALFIILPTGIFTTHGRSILNILPQLSAAPKIESVQLTAPPLETVTPSADDSEMPQSALQAPPRQNNWVAIVFFTGLGVSLLPILISVLQLRFIPKKPAGVFAMDAWAKIRPQEAKAVPLYLTSCCAAPFTAGLIREAVLLPEASTDWSLRRLRSTLYHEAAHISRKDPLVRMFASLVRAIFWFHPLIWLAHRRLVAAQEEACDEIALAGGIPADEYAEDLLQTAKDCQSPFGHCLNMAQWSQLGHRVRIILQNEKTKNPPLTMKTIAIVSLGIAATTFGLSTLGYSEAPKAVEQAPEQAQETAGPGKLEAKLNQIIIPRVDFENTSLEEAVKYLSIHSAELDTSELDPAKKGVNFVIRRPPGVDPGTLRVKELRLRNVPLAMVIKYICEQTQTTYKLDDRAVTFVPKDKAKAVEQAPEQAQKLAGPGKLEAKLNQIIIPRVDFENTSLEEAVKFLSIRSAALDTTELDPAKKGVNFVIRRPRGADADPGTLRVKELRLRNVPLAMVIKYICEQTQTTYKVDDRWVTFVPKDKAD